MTEQKVNVMPMTAAQVDSLKAAVKFYMDHSRTGQQTGDMIDALSAAQRVNDEYRKWKKEARALGLRVNRALTEDSFAQMTG